MPQDRVDKALDAAQRISGQQAPRRRDWRMPLMAAASLAAAAALVAWGVSGQRPPSQEVAQAGPSAEPEQIDNLESVPHLPKPVAATAKPDTASDSVTTDAERMDRHSGQAAPAKDAQRGGESAAGDSAPGIAGPVGKTSSSPSSSEGFRRAPEPSTAPADAAPAAPVAPAPDPRDLREMKKLADDRLDPDDARRDEGRSRARESAPGEAEKLKKQITDGDRAEDRIRMRPESLKELDKNKEELKAKEAEQGAKLEDGKEAEGKGKGADKKDKGKDDKGEKRPRVWKREGPPTFARVYVGDGNALELVSLHVTVTVEGPRARTLVDHIFRNPHDRQLEGTFEYPLPTGASPSYFAMFLGQTRDTVPPRFARRGGAAPLSQDALARLSPSELVKQVSAADCGRLQEARVVNKQKALETYEEVVRGRVDPALMEYAGGNTFRGRVFPIPAKGYNRVLIAYEEPLSSSGDQLRYRYPLPDCPLADMQVTLNAGAAECKAPEFLPKDATKEEGGSTLAYRKTWNGQGPGGDAVFTFTPPNPQIQALSSRQGEGGPLYLYARVKPELKVQQAKPFAKRAVFLLDTSLSEHPDRFDLNVKLLRAILEADKGIEHFNVLTFNVGAAWVEPKGWLDNTPAGRETLLSRLDGVLLEGATDLGAALDTLAADTRLDKGSALDLFLLSDGQITWGDADAQTLAARFEARCPSKTRFNCYRTGVGADNLELYQALTRRGGGVFNCFTPDDVKAAAAAHRSQCLQVESVRFVGGPAASDVLVAGRKAAVYPGGDVVVAARLAGVGKTQVVVEGTFNGQKFAGEYPVEARGDGELAARGWGEIAVSSLLALNDPKLEGLATAYCQEFGVGSRVASFLVLENDADYKRFNLEAERGKTLTGDMSRFLDEAWAGFGRAVSARESFVRFLNGVDPRVRLFNGEQGAHVAKLLALLGDKDFEVPEAPIAGALVRRKDVPPAYLAARDQDARDVNAYLTEAKRRDLAGDANGAARALSSVIEQHPTRDDALRLVGYRLLDLKQPAQAARLFGRVQRQRPFEPHSYRDLARGLEGCGLYGLAAVQYEIVLAGTWHDRFRDSLKTVAREEYASMMREAVRKKAVAGALADHFGNRLEGLSADVANGDLRVTISWNTDATDVDLWVIEPDGTKCFYQHQKTANGGELSQDQTQGYGPERYRVASAKKGTYKVMVHYYSANQNLLAGETHVNVVVTRHAGTPRETVERHTVILKKQGDAQEVCKVKF